MSAGWADLDGTHAPSGRSRVARDRTSLNFQNFSTPPIVQSNARDVGMVESIACLSLLYRLLTFELIGNCIGSN